MKNSNNKKLFFITILILSGLFSLSLLAQENKDELESKIDQLKGKIEKVTVKVDGKDVIFEGKEAESIAKNIRLFSKAPLLWQIDEDELLSGKGINVIRHRIKKDDKFDWMVKDGDKKKIEVQIEDGKKKVTITTEKDGKEETKILEGEEAENYLKENETGVKHGIFIDKEGVDEDNVFIIKNLGEEHIGCCCCCNKQMRHLEQIPEKGVKKIIIKERKKENETGNN